MKKINFKEMSDAELTAQLEDIRKESFNLRNQRKTGQLENPARLRQLRRDVARVMTEQTARVTNAKKA